MFTLSTPTSPDVAQDISSLKHSTTIIISISLKAFNSPSLPKNSHLNDYNIM